MRKTKVFDEGVLPWSVRYALTERSARLGADEIESLIHSPQFAASGFYLAMKLVDGQVEAQAQALEDVVCSIWADEPCYKSALGLLERTSGETVQSHKLFQISRYGQKTWEDGFYEPLAEIDESSTVNALAYACFSGIEGIIAAQKDQGFTLRFLFTDRYLISDENIGLELHPADGGYGVDAIDSDFDKTAPQVIVDDVISSGETRRAVHKRWAGSSDAAPSFIATVSL